LPVIQFSQFAPFRLAHAEPATSICTGPATPLTPGCGPPVSRPCISGRDGRSAAPCTPYSIDLPAHTGDATSQMRWPWSAPCWVARPDTLEHSHRGPAVQTHAAARDRLRCPQPGGWGQADITIRERLMTHAEAAANPRRSRLACTTTTARLFWGGSGERWGISCNSAKNGPPSGGDCMSNAFGAFWSANALNLEPLASVRPNQASVPAARSGCGDRTQWQLLGPAAELLGSLPEIP